MYGPSFLSDFMNLTFLLQTSSIKKEESPIENIKIKIENSINKALDNYIGDKNQDYQESHLGNDIYQNQYKKNFEIIKSEYKKTLSGCLSLKEIVATVLLLEKYFFKIF